MMIPDRLYTQKVFVGVGTFENVVSSFTVSVENTNRLFFDVVKVSSSLQAVTNPTTANNNIYVSILSFSIGIIT